MKTIVVMNKFVLITSIFGLISLLLYFTVAKNSFDGTWNHTITPVLLLAVFIISCTTSAFFITKLTLNDSSSDKKNKKIADALKAKTKFWYLNPTSPASRDYYALPISEKEASKKAGDKKSKSITYKLSKTSEVRELIHEGKIANLEDTLEILKFLN